MVLETQLTWTCFRHDGLVKDTLEGKIIGKPARGRKRLNTPSDLAEKDKCTGMALKRKAENRKEWQKLNRAGSHISGSWQIEDNMKGTISNH